MSSGPPQRDGYGRPTRGTPSVPARPTERPLSGAANLTFDLVGQLRAVGVTTFDRLVELGPKEAWLRLRQMDPKCERFAVLLALQGAVHDCPVDRLSQAAVDDLRHWWRRHAE